MSDAAHKKISERQAEARRQNGKKSRGPVTEEGKQRSSKNSTKHGVWAIKLQAIDGGPLREDPEQMGQFVQAVLEELNPGDSLLLRQSAIDVADKMWRLSRAQRWEAYGYTTTDLHTSDWKQADWLVFLAALDRGGAAAIRTLGESSSSLDDLWYALSSLSFHLGMTEEALEEVADEEVAKALETLVTEDFEGPEDAARILEMKAEKRELEAEQLRASVRPGVVRDELDGSFSKNSERMVGHTSRELDRSLKRYWELWERMQMDQPTVDLEVELPEAEPSELPAEEAPSSEPAEVAPDGGGIDWNEVEALLDQHEIVAALEKVLGSTGEE